MRRILHPSDFSTASQPAFKQAIELAKRDRATLELLHVTTPVVPLPAEGYVSPTTYNELAAAATAWARKRMEAAGVRATSIIVTAQPKRADLIVMGTHGRTGLSRFVLGSVASRVISTSPCPVLTARGKS